MAIVEYEAARKELLGYATRSGDGQGELLHIIEAQNHLESVFNSLSLGLTLLGLLKTAEHTGPGGGPMQIETLEGIDAEIARLTAKLQKKASARSALARTGKWLLGNAHLLKW